MATAFQAFNSLLEMFLKELYKGFPQHQELIAKAEDLLGIAIRANYKTPTELFAKHALPFVARIMARDETVLKDFDATGTIPIHLEPLWKDADSDSKEVIWQYLYSIAFMGMGLSQLDEQGLAMVEGLVKSLEGAGL